MTTLARRYSPGYRGDRSAGERESELLTWRSLGTLAALRKKNGRNLIFWKELLQRFQRGKGRKVVARNRGRVHALSKILRNQPRLPQSRTKSSAGYVPIAHNQFFPNSAQQAHTLIDFNANDNFRKVSRGWSGRQPGRIGVQKKRPCQNMRKLRPLRFAA